MQEKMGQGVGVRGRALTGPKILFAAARRMTFVYLNYFFYHTAYTYICTCICFSYLTLNFLKVIVDGFFLVTVVFFLISTLYQRVFIKKYWTKLFLAFTVRNKRRKLPAVENRNVIIVLDFPNL